MQCPAPQSGNPDRPGQTQIHRTESTLEEEFTAVDKKLNRTWQCTFVSQKEKQSSQQFETDPSFSLVRSHLQYCIWLWGSWHKRTWTCWSSPEETTKMLRGLEHISYEDEAERVGIFMCTSTSGEVLREIQDNTATLSADDASLFHFHFNLVSSHRNERFPESFIAWSEMAN